MQFSSKTTGFSGGELNDKEGDKVYGMLDIEVLATWHEVETVVS